MGLSVLILNINRWGTNGVLSTSVWKPSLLRVDNIEAISVQEASYQRCKRVRFRIKLFNIELFIRCAVIYVNTLKDSIWKRLAKTIVKYTANMVVSFCLTPPRAVKESENSPRIKTHALLSWKDLIFANLWGQATFWRIAIICHDSLHQRPWRNYWSTDRHRVSSQSLSLVVSE